MNYQINSKNRKLRYRFHQILGSLSFNFIHLRGSLRLVLLGEVFLLVSLFFPWFSIGTDITATAFSSFLGRTGFMLMFLAIVLMSLILSNRTKEIMKTRVGIHFSDHTAIIFFGITKLFLVISSFSFMRSIVYFTKDIVFYDAPIYSIIGAILIVVGGIIAYREVKRETLSTLYIENNQATDALFQEYESILSKSAPEKKNMTLPI
ncbi:MAG: hypothetical protein ACOYN2_03965 [Patescibacteria group bacterium]